MTKRWMIALVLLALACGGDDVGEGSNDASAERACRVITQGPENTIASALSLADLNENHEAYFGATPYNIALQDRVQGVSGYLSLVVQNPNIEHRMYTKAGVRLQFDDPAIDLTGPLRNLACPDQQLNEYSFTLGEAKKYPLLVDGQTAHAWLFLDLANDR